MTNRKLFRIYNMHKKFRNSQIYRNNHIYIEILNFLINIRLVKNNI